MSRTAAEVAAPPLDEARRSLHLSYRELALRLGDLTGQRYSHVALWRYCLGLRPAPLALYHLLGVPLLASQQAAYVEEKRRPKVTVSLPPGVTEQEALAAVVRGVSEALSGRREVAR